MSMCEQHYSLRWNDYTVKLVTAFQSLRDEEDFLDVTLACDGHQYSAHKMVLSACSPFFRTLLKANPCQHPIVILKDVGHIELERLLEFMYNGEVNIAQDQLAAFLKTAENLKIRGLAGSSDDSEQSITRDASLGNLTSSESLALSGHSSPFATYSAGQGPSSKDCNMSTEGDAYTRTDSPASKKQRKLNSSNMHLEDSISSQNADTLVSESGSEVDPLSVSATSLMCEGESRAERRELKVEPPEGTNDSYGDSMKLGHAHQIGDDPSATYPVAVAGPSGLPMISQDGVGAHEQGDVSALMTIANAVQALAYSDRPIKCPLCQSIIKQARNLRRHVLKRHLPAAQRGEITEADVKHVLEQKLKTITVTPLTDEELRQVQQRTRRRGVKSPRKRKGVAALPSEINSSNIDEMEVTIRKLPQKKEKKERYSSDTNLMTLSTVSVGHVSTTESTPVREDILQEALAARDKDLDLQDEVMDLATTQQQLPPLSVVVSHSDHVSVQPAEPMSLTVTQTAGVVHARIPSETALHAGVRVQSESPLHLHRDVPMPSVTFEPPVTISESLSTYHASSPSQVLSQSPSPVVSGYVPTSYWSASGVAGLPTSTFQPHQSVFAPTHCEYFTGVHMMRPAALDRMQQPRRKHYQ